MPYKDLEVRKAKGKVYSAKHYQKNKETSSERIKENKKRMRLEWQEFKATFKCVNCSFNHPAALDFHHVDRTNKRDVSTLVKNSRYTAAYEEIKKCVVLCANCHRIHHYDERKAKKQKKKKR